jgi:hypothetical protein
MIYLGIGVKLIASPSDASSEGIGQALGLCTRLGYAGGNSGHVLNNGLVGSFLR